LGRKVVSYSIKNKTHGQKLHPFTTTTLIELKITPNNMIDYVLTRERFQQTQDLSTNKQMGHNRIVSQIGSLIAYKEEY